jgi:3-carboxy-cis,cis-muconate cycloisomerase
MPLFDSLFGAPAVNDIFSAAGTVQRMLDFEAALADAQAEAGVVPTAAAAAIRQQCRVGRFDLATLAVSAARAGNIAIPLVQQLTAFVREVDRDAAGYVHWGATSQDAIDTALALQLRDALALIDHDLMQLRQVVARLADHYRSTPVVARTWMQHAVPTTLGLQMAGWLDALDRHAGRLTDVRRRDIVLQLGGAGGTLAALGGRGPDVAALVAQQLDVPMPALSWHTHRDRVGAVVTALALLTGTLGKIARDIALQSQTEIAELAEPSSQGRGTSSSMPHKRNPVAAAVALAAAVRVPALTGGILAGMVQEHERGLGGWQAEWEAVPEVVRLAAGALHHMLPAVSDLSVDASHMRANLEATAGLVYSESVTMALARRVGRVEAHTIVEGASRRALSERRHLQEILATDPAVRAQLTAAELAALFDPAPHVAAAQPLIERALRADRDAGGSVDRR